jgi:OPT oligopeptide transporter protein
LTFSPNADQWLLVVSTQLIGFSIGGICKRILVAPASMIWPSNLAAAALFNTLHTQDTTNTTRSWHDISRDRFFIYVFIGYFFYSQLPSSFSIFSS